MKCIEELNDRALTGTHVRVWCIHLDRGRTTLSQFDALLSSAERTRAEETWLERERERFIVAHGARRTILGRITGRELESLSFGSTPLGNPVLVQPVGAPAVQFSMSRCHGLALIAVSNGPALGVDIERINAGFPCNDIAARLMSPDDYELWRAVPASAQRRAFFRWWTRTEAYAKALGTGLTQPLTDLDLPSASSRWIIVDLEVGPRYTAALSVGRDRQGRRGNPNGEDAPE